MLVLDSDRFASKSECDRAGAIIPDPARTNDEVSANNEHSLSEARLGTVEGLVHRAKNCRSTPPARSFARSIWQSGSLRVRSCPSNALRTESQCASARIMPLYISKHTPFWCRCRLPPPGP